MDMVIEITFTISINVISIISIMGNHCFNSDKRSYT